MDLRVVKSSAWQGRGTRCRALIASFTCLFVREETLGRGTRRPSMFCHGEAAARRARVLLRSRSGWVGGYSPRRSGFSRHQNSGTQLWVFTTWTQGLRSPPRGAVSGDIPPAAGEVPPVPETAPVECLASRLSALGRSRVWAAVVLGRCSLW